MSAGRHVAAGRAAERADLIAYLERRLAAAAGLAARDPAFADWAEDRRRQIEVIKDEITHELHLGCADVAARTGKGTQV